MKITKYGQCCMLIEENGVRLLTDPGNMTEEQNSVTDVDVLLITHEHGDHFHVESVKKILMNNPEIKIVTNKAVGALLDKEGIAYIVVGEGQINEDVGIKFEGFGHSHAEIYEDMGQVENTSYFIGPRLYYPGDAFFVPEGREVDILALPVAGPFAKVKDVVDFALAAKPHAVFPVHDSMLKNPGMQATWFQPIFEKAGIVYNNIELNTETEF